MNKKKKKSVLGRGLGSILRNPETDITSNSNNNRNIVGNITFIKIDLISRNPFQPRSRFDQDQLEELSHSIETLGVIQPITVRKLGNDKYQLISGERRLRASNMAGKTKIPAFIRIANDYEMLEMALVENIQRTNLDPIEIALSYQRLINECKLTQEQCAEKVGKKRSSISNFLRLLKLPEEIQLALQHGSISMGHARALVNIKDKKTQINIFNDIVSNGFSVREVEQLVRTFAKIGYKQTSKPKRFNISNQLPFAYQQKIHNLSKYLKKDIDVKRTKKGKGKLIISFESDEDLISLMEKFSENYS